MWSRRQGRAGRDRRRKDYELSGQCSCKLKPRIGGNPLKKRGDNPLLKNDESSSPK